MKKKISFKLFCPVLTRDWGPAVCWIGGMFGIKDGSTLSKFAKRVFMVSVAAISLSMAVTLVYAFVDHLGYKYERNNRCDDSNMAMHIVGNGYAYYTNYWIPGYVKNNITDEVVWKDLVWLHEPAQDVSLSVYKTNENSEAISLSIPAKYRLSPNIPKPGCSPIDCPLS